MRTSPRFELTALLTIAVVGCQGDRPAPDAMPASDATAAADATPGLVELTAVDRTFQGPDSVEAGWVTIRFTNASTMTHFAVVERMPEGYGVAEQQEQVAPIFQDGMDLLAAGKADEAMAKFGEVPEWFGQIVFTGGPGLTAPGHTSQATVHLDPGTYILECYVKTEGIFHSYKPDSTAYGMVHQLTVTAPASSATEPQASTDLTLSSARGIEMSGTPVAGPQTVAVHFEDQTVHENFVGHDVHLVRLADDTDTDALVSWMDWTQVGGLQTPAPAQFVGGLNELPAGMTGYMTVTLEPGRYAWIAEVPNAAEKGMLKEFTVAPSS
ncbi:MAG: hypothetical protein PVJ02_07060 [Gemmatimonadota bacterium]